MSGVLDGIRRGDVPPGVYRLLDYQGAARLLRTVEEWGWYAAHIDGKMVESKGEFIAAAGKALAFPDYAHGRGFGKNWDAFEEMINDMSWRRAPGYALLYDYVYYFAGARPQEWQTALAILAQACANWQQWGVPFYVLLRHSYGWNRATPKLIKPKREEEIP